MLRVKNGKIIECAPGEKVEEGEVVIPVAYRGERPTHFMLDIADTNNQNYGRVMGADDLVHCRVHGIQKNPCKECLIGDFEDAREKTQAVSGQIRKFSTGATRDTDTGKYDYEAFFSPLVLERRAAFMHKNRVQKDGSLRDGDNWQKGIPLDTYAKSEFRHHMEFWKLHRGLPATDNLGNPVDIETAICAAMFNLEGYLHELLKKK